MNKEPKHFMSMFGGRIIVFEVSEVREYVKHNYATKQTENNGS